MPSTSQKSSIEGEIIGGAEELLEKDNEKSREDVITKVLSLEYKHLDVLHVESKRSTNAQNYRIGASL